ncbi:MAB_1171c family putative transporter [Streptomyces sp. NPDC029004]|uniref:MAB_1171c family putative transporter n=1 Tax=Streptomyces sp. NPDC029004 TaxID=3154490 RepID=UPI0033F482CA
MNGTDYYYPAAALGIAFAAKVPALRHGWRNPLVRSVCALILMAGAGFFFAAPPTITVVNRVIGIPNVSAPLVYAILCAFSCASLILLVNWRGGPRERIRRTVRVWIAGYGVVIAALFVLFALGDAPDERLRDLDTYYATTPYIREMILVYLAGHTVAAVMVTALCWRWSRKVTRWLRAGLVILVVGFLLNLGFGIAKFVAVIARWTGNNLDDWSTSIAPPVASAGALLTTVGFLLPLMAPRMSETWHAWRAYRWLGPLWRELRAASSGSTVPLRLSRWSSLDLRVTHREAAIYDMLLVLAPYFDTTARLRAYDAALERGKSAEDAEVIAVAAMVAATLHASLRREPHPYETASDSSLSDLDAPLPGLSAAMGSGRRHLARVSRAFATSPVVAAARRQAASPEGLSV